MYLVFYRNNVRYISNYRKSHFQSMLFFDDNCSPNHILDHVPSNVVPNEMIIFAPMFYHFQTALISIDNVLRQEMLLFYKFNFKIIKTHFYSST